MISFPVQHLLVVPSRAVTMKPSDSSPADTGAPHPGSKQMPQWTVGELPPAPVFTWRNWIGMLGPGLVMGAAAIGGGEWTLGPKVTAQYGGAMLWLATFSILFQVIYNIEICRYTLYSGEPIFTGKFRLLPGPIFWVFLYLLVDWGSFFPYLATNAAIPLYSLVMGDLPPKALNLSLQDMAKEGLTAVEIAGVQRAWWIHKGLTLSLFCAMMLPLIFGGKVYNSLKAIMSFKLVYVLGLLLFLGIFYTSWSSWKEIVSGFFQVGNVPLAEVKPEESKPKQEAEPTEPQPKPKSTPSPPASETTSTEAKPAPKPESDKKPPPKIANIFRYFSEHGSFPNVDFSQIAYLCALAAIAGNGGLTNAPISAFVRDQGWGMGKHVGAIASMVGGTGIELSHEGKVFLINPESLKRWHKWVWHVVREQAFVWLPACFVGVALPSILSVQFIERGKIEDDWNLATLTAKGVEQYVASPPGDVLASQVGLGSLLGSPSVGWVFFKLILFCGLLVLMTSGLSTADGFVRRWVDLIWVGLPVLRTMKTDSIKFVYFGVLMFYFLVGFTMLLLPQAPGLVTKLATTGYNYALAFSCWHALAVNLILLPKQLRPNWFSRIGLVVAGCFFLTLGIMASWQMTNDYFKAKAAAAAAAAKEAPAQVAPEEPMVPALEAETLTPDPDAGGLAD